MITTTSPVDMLSCDVAEVQVASVQTNMTSGIPGVETWNRMAFAAATAAAVTFTTTSRFHRYRVTRLSRTHNVHPSIHSSIHPSIHPFFCLLFPCLVAYPGSIPLG